MLHVYTDAFGAGCEENYVVKKGDNLSMLLYKRGLRGSQLYGARGWVARNEIRNPHVRDWSKLRVGERLQLVWPYGIAPAPSEGKCFSRTKSQARPQEQKTSSLKESAEKIPMKEETLQAPILSPVKKDSESSQPADEESLSRKESRGLSVEGLQSLLPNLRETKLAVRVPFRQQNFVLSAMRMDKTKVKMRDGSFTLKSESASIAYSYTESFQKLSLHIDPQISWTFSDVRRPVVRPQGDIISRQEGDGGLQLGLSAGLASSISAVLFEFQTGIQQDISGPAFRIDRTFLDLKLSTPISADGRWAAVTYFDINHYRLRAFDYSAYSKTDIRAKITLKHFGIGLRYDFVP